MALCTDAAMVLYYDIAGDNADHDDWHTCEHLHERLSIPGFVRATRWVAREGAPRYMVIYEVTGTDIARSPAYLARLNDPTPWTRAMMSRFRGMVRGFCHVLASSGYGMGNAVLSVRFTPRQGEEPELRKRLANELLPSLASQRGMAGAYLLQPAPPPPMTQEQTLRGPDTPMSWLVLVTAYEAQALERMGATHLFAEALATSRVNVGSYALQYMASAQEVARTPPGPPRGARA